jgi:hypothetical protein
MSYKGQDVEDKSLAPELPRSIRELEEAMDELRQAVAGRDKGAITASLERAERVRHRTNRDQLECSRRSGPMAHLIAYADALNAASAAMGDARLALARL